MITSPTFSQALTAAFLNAMAEVMTMVPCRIEAVDAATGFVDVLPQVKELVNNEDGARVSIEPQTIRGVPVIFIGGAGFRLTVPVVVGDDVVAFFSSRSLERWKRNGGTVDPMDPRRFSINDAVVVPGLRALPQRWTGGADDAMTAGKDGGPQVVMRATQIEIGGSAQVPAVDAAVLGTTRKALEDSFLSTLNTQLVAGAAGATAAAAAATNNAALSLGPLLPLGAGFTAEAAGLTALAAGLTAAAAAVGVFQAGLATTLSSIVKVK